MLSVPTVGHVVGIPAGADGGVEDVPVAVAKAFVVSQPVLVALRTTLCQRWT
jgi:hypothetical protein